MFMILGSGRSGTTWLGKLFDSHPDVLYRHEPDIVLRNDDIPYLPARDDLETYREDAAIYLKALAEVRAPKAVMSRPFFAKSYRGKPVEAAHRVFGYAVSLAEQLRIPVLGALSIPDMIDAAAPLHIVIKSVSSLNRCALFAAADPQLRIAHLIRHPCGVIASTLRAIETRRFRNEAFLRSACDLPEARNYSFTYNDLIERPIEQKLAFSWMVFNDKAANDMGKSPQYRLVHYEDLCRKLETRLPELFAFAGIDWRPETTNFIEALQRNDNVNAAFYDVMRPPTASLDKWKNQLNATQIENIHAIVSHARSKPVRDTIR